MALELVIGIAVLAAVVGGGIGYVLAGRGSGKARVAELERSLASAQQELADYKQQVFGEFAETADKFRALDKSYNDLHRQLAESSVALCGDAGTQLLTAPEQESLQVLEEDIVVGESVAEEDHEVPTLTQVAEEPADEPERKSA